MSAILGDLTITLADGSTLTSTTDIDLARQWAEHEHGREAWAAMSFRGRNVELAAALAELRRAFEAG